MRSVYSPTTPLGAALAAASIIFIESERGEVAVVGGNVVDVQPARAKASSKKIFFIMNSLKVHGIFIMLLNAYPFYERAALLYLLAWLFAKKIKSE